MNIRLLTTSLPALMFAMMVLQSCGTQIEAESPHRNSNTDIATGDDDVTDFESSSATFEGSAFEAMERGLVSISGQGLNTYRQIEVTLINLSNRTLELELDAGMYFDNPRAQSQNLILLQDTDIRLTPHQSIKRMMSSACTNASWSVPQSDNNWPVAKVPKNLDAALKFYGEHEAKINAYLKKKNPEELGTSEQQKRFLQVAIWAYMDDNPEDIRRMLAQEVFQNDIDKANQFFDATYSEAREISDMMKRRDSESMKLWIKEKGNEILQEGQKKGRSLLKEGANRLEKWRSN